MKIVSRSKKVKLSRIFTLEAGKAARARARVAKNPKSFGAVAAAVSEDANAKQTKGDLGFVRRGLLEEPLDRFAFSAKPGDMSPVIPLRHGFAVVLVDELKPGRPITFEKARSDVARLARADSEHRLIETLRADAKISVNESLVKGAVGDAAKP